ncbi:MAG: hypothetical protein PWP45_429 [Tepidanaerobacteraceae bacterium]|nr:hypothetical protein [Tepidanaerobacteraceae bacterium]
MIEHWSYSNARFMKTKKSVFLLILVLLAAIFFSRFQIDRKTVIIILNEDENKKTVIPVISGKFTITFIHSIEKTPVYELYEISADNKITLNEVRFYSQGTGLPFSTGGIFKNENGQFVIREKRTFSRLSLRVSPLPGHSITVDGKRLDFLDIARSEDLITIYTENRWALRKKSKEKGV